MFSALTTDTLLDFFFLFLSDDNNSDGYSIQSAHKKKVQIKKKEEFNSVVKFC